MGSHTQPFPKRLGGSYQSLPLPLPLKKGPGEGKGEFSRVEILRMEEEEKEEEREGLYPQAVEGEEPGLLVGAGLQKEQCLWAGFELREGEGQSPLEVIGQVGVTVGRAPLQGEGLYAGAGGQGHLKLGEGRWVRAGRAQQAAEGIWVKEEQVRQAGQTTHR